jgi:uncharacterized damage-inducible protein DinB
MYKSHFLNLGTFNFWANKKIMDFISGHVPAAMADQKIISSFPSVKRTIYHIWDAESIWLERMSGRSPMEFASINFNGSFKEGLTKFLDNSQMIHSFLIAKDESYFSGNVSYTHTSGKFYSHRVEDVLTHVMNHSTFHRGQLVTMFRQLGITEGIPKTDLIEYCREKDLVEN